MTPDITIGDDVMALGTSETFGAMVTFGNITHTDRTFSIPPFHYENIYETTAPIEEGNSGEPLLHKETDKAIAINAARDETDKNISYSIPLHQVMPLVEQWLTQPMSAEDIWDKWGTSLIYPD